MSTLVNTLECILIAFSSIVLFKQPQECNLEGKIVVTSLTVLTFQSVMYTMVVKHPKFTFLNVYFTMFSNVGWTFVKFLLCYGILIITFVLGLHILLHKGPIYH